MMLNQQKNSGLKKIQISFFMMVIFFLPLISNSASLSTKDLLINLSPGELSETEILKAPKTVRFNQNSSGGTNASRISKVTLAYFTSANCTGNKAGTGFYTTPDGTSFAITIGTSFALSASSAWKVGSTQLSISDMTTIQSIAVTFKSLNKDTPQANFSGKSYACIPVTCSSGPAGECISLAGTQNFTLKTTAAVGDPANGGIIACINSAISPPANSGYFVVPSGDNSSSITWGGRGTTTGATSVTNGTSNTSTIVTALGVGTYAARLCSTYSAAGGYTSGWFLPARSQLNCIYINKTSIGGTFSLRYWSSTEQDSTLAIAQNFSTGNAAGNGKELSNSVRCALMFSP